MPPKTPRLKALLECELVSLPKAMGFDPRHLAERFPLLPYSGDGKRKRETARAHEKWEIAESVHQLAAPLIPFPPFPRCSL